MLKEAINDRGKFFDRHLSATLMVNKRQKQKVGNELLLRLDFSSEFYREREYISQPRTKVVDG